MQPGKLTALAIRKAVKPNRYSDGGGLYFRLKPSGGRDWTFRFTMPGGKAREMVLGTAVDMTLAEARERARDARRTMASGCDPIEARLTARAEAVGQGFTFREVAGVYITAHESAWRNAKHRAQWTSTLATYAHPVMGALPLGRVAVGDVLRVLEPVWRVKPETASRLRGRIEAILDYATARGWRTGDNPARWKGHLANLLPKRSKLGPVKHHAALPWAECPDFTAALAAQPGTAALALRLTILTAARTSEVTGATWGELDRVAKVWTVPGDRMKAGRDHRVPLSDTALEILAEMHTPDVLPSDPVFAGAKPRVGLSNMAMTAVLRRMKRPDVTVHGFRSTFRDWCAEATAHPREIAEAALAHTLRDKVEAAYLRGDRLDRRAKLMADWAVYLAQPAVAETGQPVWGRTARA